MPINKTKLFLIVAIMTLLSGSAFADDIIDKLLASNPTLKKADVTVKSMNPTPYGLLEVITAKGDIFYVSQDLKYAFVGNVVELSTGRNLTIEKVKTTRKQAEPVSIGGLPADNAIVEGTGSRKIAIFTDPTCPHCKTLDLELKKIPDLTVVRYLLPISPAGYKAAMTVCSEKITGKDCDVILRENKAIASRLGIDGTPTILFPDGNLHIGGMSAENIERELGGEQK